MSFTVRAIGKSDSRARCAGLDLFFAHGISLGEPSGSADIDAEEVQEPGLDAGGFGDHGGVAVVGGDQAQIGEGLEDGPAGGPGGGRPVAGQAGQGAAVGGQGLADLAFDQAEISRARQITVIRAVMRRLVFKKIGATARGPLNSP